MTEENPDIELEERNDDGELYEHYRIAVDKGQALLRIDKYLMEHIQGASRNKIQNAAKAQCILVGGKPVKQNYRVKPLDVISVLLPNPPREIEITPENIPINIVYEDDDVIIIDKQPNLVVHPGFGNYTGTLLNALAYYYQSKTDKEGNPITPYLTHRIDKTLRDLSYWQKTRWLRVFWRNNFSNTLSNANTTLLCGAISTRTMAPSSVI